MAISRFSQFVSILDKNALFFVRADKLGDPFEGSYSKANIAKRRRIYEKMPLQVLRQLPRSMKKTGNSPS